ncbi:gibberellin 2-beta-dioxygenase 4 isoform X1 [Capsicum galapagoense]
MDRLFDLTRKRKNMAVSPDTMPENSFIDFRAPPPSPIASGRRSCVRNDEILTEFLQNSLKVPDLVLPDRVFPRQKSIRNPFKLDFQSLASLNSDSMSRILDSVATIGCFEVVNHGISEDLIKSVSSVGDGIFGISPEIKEKLIRSSEKAYGFEEFHGEDERETSEEFVWYRGDQNFNKEMEGIWPHGFLNFSEKMEKLLDGMEDIARKILQFLQQNTPKKLIDDLGDEMQEKGDLPVASICYLHKHKGSLKGDEEYINTLKYDVIRMLIRGSEFPHALCLHVSNGCSEFHVYSKKGWISFQPDKDSLIVTIGDLLQTWSGGQYKHVIGRPVYQGQTQDCISMALLISPPKNNEDSTKHEKEKTISIGQQLIIAMAIILIYNFFMYLYKKF